MKKVKAGACPKCGGTSFVGKRTVKGLVAGGLLFAPQRLKCASCGSTLKSGSASPSRPTQRRQPRLKPGETLTPGGFVRRADGVILVPEEAKRLHDSFRAAGNIVGLTPAEIAQRVGFDADPIPARRHANGYSHLWSQPGYKISILFGHDNRALGVLQNSEQLG